MAPMRPPYLGELETAVMERVWSDGPCEVKEMHRAVGRQRRITLNTVQSTMERLYRKGLLAREKVSHAYVYSAQVSREELTARLVGDVVAGLVGNDSEPMLSALVDLTARTGEKNLKRLERMVAARRAGTEDKKR